VTDEELVKNLAWYREEAGLESAYPVTHPMAMFIRAIAARERLKNREWVGLTDDERNAISRHHAYVSNIIEATEAKLRSKNT
jgi:hypothetical protein